MVKMKEDASLINTSSPSTAGNALDGKLDTMYYSERFNQGDTISWTANF